jgi:hypothetical protein
MSMQFNEKEEILKTKAFFYYSLNLRCHIKLRPTGFRNGKIVSEFNEEGSYWMFLDLRRDNAERLFIDEVFDIKDYEEPIKEVKG